MNRFNFESLKKFIGNGSTSHTETHINFIMQLDDLLDENVVKSVYPKKFSDTETCGELILFLEKGFLRVFKNSQDQIVSEVFFGEMLEKRLVSGIAINQNQGLELFYASGKTLLLDSTDDSGNYDNSRFKAEEAYSKEIRRLWREA